LKKYLGLLVALVIMASLTMATVVSADDGKWVKTDFGLVYLDKDSAGFKSLGKYAQETALVVGYGNPCQLTNDGKNIDPAHWVAFDGQVTYYPNWFTYRAAETYGNQKDVPVFLPRGSDWYTLPVGKGY
jgi:hypothetical protein